MSDAPKTIRLQPFVTAGEVFKLPGSDHLVLVVPIQLFRTAQNIILRVGDTTYWFDENGKYDGPEMRLARSPDSALVSLLDSTTANKGKAPATAYFSPGSKGHDAEVAGWPGTERPT